MKFLLTALFLLSTLLASSQLESIAEDLYFFTTTNDDVLKNWVGKVAAEKRIIGLGEVSHYTKECYELKHTMIMELIRQGYDGLILEVDFGQALIWNDFVLNGSGNLDTIVAQSGWFTYRTQEFKNLLADIRQYNVENDTSFQVFGMEMTAMNHNVDWIREYLQEFSPGATDLLKLLEVERPIVAFQSHTVEQQQGYWQLYYQLNAFLQEKEEQLIAQSGAQKFAVATRIAELVRQYATYISHDDFSLKVEFRDQFSARNVWWCLEQLGENSQVAIWAHNGHIAKESVLFNYNVLGHHLQRWFAEAYYAIGFTFNEGEFGAFGNNGFGKWQISPATDSTSLTYALDQLHQPFVLFDIRQAVANHSAEKWINNSIPIRTDISESFDESQPKMMEINLKQTYDALIYIDQMHYPTTISWQR